mgnify:CR=1 FL=1
MAESRVVERVKVQGADTWFADADALEHSGQVGTRGRVSSLYLFCKRVGDIALAVAGIILCLPMWIIVAALIKLESPGPILFRQRRPGHRGVPFLILKFRTMCNDAEDRLDEVLATNKEPDHSLIRVDEDPRVTRIGYWLRKWSLDETPQFINVVRGEMSIVGPRPISRPIPDPRGYLRLEARPGITGVWQTNGRKLTDCKHMLDLDMEYLANRSLVLDISILGRTVGAVLRAEGAE